jgi:hypothetical protein
MTAPAAHRTLPYWAGVALGPAAWALNEQAIYAFTPHACAGATGTSVALAIGLAVVAGCGTLISLRAIRRHAAAEWTEAEGGWAQNFMAWLGVGMGALFALVILDQLAAAVMIGPCLR